MNGRTKFFLVLPDKRLQNPLSFTINEEQLQKAEPVAINIGKINNLVPVDFIVKKNLFNSYFFLSDDLMKVFEMYDKSISFEPIFITNESHSLQKAYWRTDLAETKDAIVGKFNKPQDMVIKEDRLKNKPVHKLYYEKQTFLIANIYVAESILRRLPVGVWLQEIECTK